MASCYNDPDNSLICADNFAFQEKPGLWEFNLI